MVECGGVDSKKWCAAGNVVSAPRVEHARVEIGEGDHRNAGSDDSQQRACAVWHPLKTHLSPFAGGEGIQRGVKSEMARGGWDEFFAEQCRVGWVVADDVDMRVWHGRRICAEIQSPSSLNKQLSPIKKQHPTGGW